MFNRIPGVSPLDARSSTLLVETIKNVCRHCQMSEGAMWGGRGTLTPGWEADTSVPTERGLLAASGALGLGRSLARRSRPKNACLMYDHIS